MAELSPTHSSSSSKSAAGTKKRRKSDYRRRVDEDSARRRALSSLADHFQRTDRPSPTRAGPEDLQPLVDDLDRDGRGASPYLSAVEVTSQSSSLVAAPTPTDAAATCSPFSAGTIIAADQHRKDSLDVVTKRGGSDVVSSSTDVRSSTAYLEAGRYATTPASSGALSDSPAAKRDAAASLVTSAQSSKPVDGPRQTGGITAAALADSSNVFKSFVGFRSTRAAASSGDSDKCPLVDNEALDLDFVDVDVVGRSSSKKKSKSNKTRSATKQADEHSRRYGQETADLGLGTLRTVVDIHGSDAAADDRPRIDVDDVTSSRKRSGKGRKQRKEDAATSRDASPHEPILERLSDGEENRAPRKVKEKRTKKAKRFAKRAGVTVWKGLRISWKFMYSGLAMFAQSPAMNLNVTQGMTEVWRLYKGDSSSTDNSSTARRAFYH